MWMEIATLATLALACISGIVWTIRLEGKVNEHDQLFVEREKQTKARNDADSERLQDLKDHLIRIESKLDTVAYSAVRNQAQNLHG